MHTIYMTKQTLSVEHSEVSCEDNNRIYDIVCLYKFTHSKYG